MIPDPVVRTIRKGLRGNAGPDPIPASPRGGPAGPYVFRAAVSAPHAFLSLLAVLAAWTCLEEPVAAGAEAPGAVRYPDFWFVAKWDGASAERSEPEGRSSGAVVGGGINAVLARSGGPLPPPSAGLPLFLLVREADALMRCGEAEKIAREYARTLNWPTLSRIPPMFDDARHGTARKAVAALPASPREAGYGVAVWILADRPSVASGTWALDLDMSDGTLEIFREWLRREYGDIEVLNRQWGTRFGSWREVRPETADECLARNFPSLRAPAAGNVRAAGRPAGGGDAPGRPGGEGMGGGDAERPDAGAPPPVDGGRRPEKDGGPGGGRVATGGGDEGGRIGGHGAATGPGNENFSAWADHRAFMDWAMARVAVEYRDALRTFDPAARVGVAG
ncbi:MAG: beta-galactosidase, partial [Planctomycetota bacterium]|nr:beta-galactosidase [Planctomycetota bacterium]